MIAVVLLTAVGLALIGVMPDWVGETVGFMLMMALGAGLIGAVLLMGAQ